MITNIIINNNVIIIVVVVIFIIDLDKSTFQIQNEY